MLCSVTTSERNPPDGTPEVARATLGDEHVARVFRALADEHCAKRAQLERDLVWRSIAGRARDRELSLRPWFWRLALPLAVACCVAGAVIVWTHRPSLEYELAGAATVHEGEIRAGRSGATLSFSDGSAIHARGQSLLSVSVVGQRAVITRLLRGTLNVAVERDEVADWRFLAGPYEVRVVGTRFDVAWEPESSLLTVEMFEGAVRVTGPGKFDRTLRAGETLRRSGIEPELMRDSARDGPATLPSRDLEGELSLPDLAPSRLDPPVQLNAPRPARRAGAEEAPKAATPDPRELLEARVPPEDDWPLLVARGKFAEVVEAAEREGEDDVLKRHEVSDLRALAQAARYTGKTLLALRAWTAVRDRFKGNAAALQAAFFLGRIYDELDHPVPARDWLDTYLAEAPDGVYASEALGRRLSLAKRLGAHADAERLARQYLERFPSGAYGRTARGLLSERAGH